MKLRNPFQTSFGTTVNRRILVVEVGADGLTGWAEITTPEEPFYNAETTETAWHVFSDFIVPMVLGKTISTPGEAATLMTGIRVRGDTAMTGEATLRGLVLPVGGIKEKVLAAHRAGIKRVILPERVRKDLNDVPDQAKKDIEFIFVTQMDEVLRNALESDPFNVPKPEVVAPAAPPEIRA